MERSIRRALENRNKNHLFPFIWVTGDETEEVLREEVLAVYRSGIRGFIIEGRPAKDYCGQGWWDTAGILLDEAKRHEMKVWFLDDAHFPSGYANGAIVREHPELSKQYFTVHALDVSGPVKGIRFDTNTLLNPVRMEEPERGFMGMEPEEPPRLPADDFVCAVLACRTAGVGIMDETIDLTGRLAEGVIHWDVPEGFWKLYTVVVTRHEGGSALRVNMADRESARLQIPYVFEEYQKHLGDEFGKTVVGFFGDEAEIGNSRGYHYNDKLGQGAKAIPYSAELCEMLADRLGEDWKKHLPKLWFEFTDEKTTADIRYAYMDCMTKLISRNYIGALSEWCEAHGLIYASHILEDNNAHSRMGCGMGHYFRALDGQHMAGIDDVGGQVMFGGENSSRENWAAPGDGECYHYTLGKLGSSHAHIDRKKKGNTICEIYGTYGWELSTRMMRYIADHFLVRGANNYIYHAFSAKYPKQDCAPQFYCRGEYPLYRPLHLVNEYINRVSDVFSEGVHRCNVAILYHGESDWAGKTMMMQKPARELLEHQIDFDFLPNDVFCEGSQYDSSFEAGVLSVGTGTYRALVICECEYLPIEAARFAAEASEGFAVYFLNALPKGIIGGTKAENEEALAALENAKVIPLEQLADCVRRDGMGDVSISRFFPGLRYMKYQKDTVLYMFSNESATDCFNGRVTVACDGIPVAYDAYHNRLHTVEYQVKGQVCEFSLCLPPYQSVILSMEQEVPAEAEPFMLPEEKVQKITGPYQVSYVKAKQYPAFGEEEVMEKLQNISDVHPQFSGVIRYRSGFELKTDVENAAILLPEVFEVGEVWLDGTQLGIEISPPYLYFCKDTLRAGKHELIVEVTTTWQNEKLAEETEAVMPFVQASVVMPSGMTENPMVLAGCRLSGE